MNKNRKAFIDQVVKDIEALAPGSENAKIYKQALEKMPEGQFQAILKAARNATSEHPDYSQPFFILPVVQPNMEKYKITTDNNLKLAKKWGVEFFQRIWMTDRVTKQTYLTNLPYLVIDLPMTRPAQTLDKKIAIPDHNRSIDDRTDQVTGDSKGASISYPEVQILNARGLEDTILEFIKARGGDSKVGRLMDKQIKDTGSFDLDTVKDADTQAKSTETLSHILTGMHLENNLKRS